MEKLFDIINIPFGYILRFIADIGGGNFAIAVFVFTLLINLAFIPLTIKSQKASVQQLRIKPKLDALKEKCGDDRQKYSQEMQELYQKEGVSMGGGCLPMIFRMVVMLSIYYLIMSPVTYLAQVEKSKVNNLNTVVYESFEVVKKADKAEYEKLTKNLEWTPQAKNANQLGILNVIRDDEKLEDLNKVVKQSFKKISKSKLPNEDYSFAKYEEEINYVIKMDKDADVDFDLFGINLLLRPYFGINIIEAWDKTWIMPLVAFAAQMLSSVVSMLLQKKQNPDAPNMMGMMLTMPLMSLFIGFTFPCGVTFYWACSSLIGGAIQILVQQFYGPHRLLANERAKELAKQCDFETTQIKKFGAIEE